MAGGPEGERAAHPTPLRCGIQLRARCLGEHRYACRGTTADCVIVSLLGLIPPKVDMVISGINHGPNLGTDILFSSTAAGAAPGRSHGRAVGRGFPGRVRACLRFLAAPLILSSRNLEIFRELWTDDHFLNVNFPSADADHPESTITFPSRRIYKDRLNTYRAPNGDTFCFVYGAVPEAHYEAGSDCQVLSEGKISISPIHAHPRNWVSIEERYRRVRFL